MKQVTNQKKIDFTKFIYKYMIDQFISKSNIIHNGKYDYSLVEYINTNTKVSIICPNHGVFNQTPILRWSRKI